MWQRPSRRSQHIPAALTISIATFALYLTTSLFLRFIAAQSNSSITSISDHYPIDWSLVPAVQPDFVIPDNTDIGQCICDLTWNSCDVNCKCDPDCTATEIDQFSSSLPEGPKSTKVMTCMDPDLISVNRRGALTVSLVDNMLCVAEDNNPSLGEYITAPTTLSSSDFSSAISSTSFYFDDGSTDVQVLEPVASGEAPEYKVGNVILAAKVDSGGALQIINGGGFAIPTASSDGSCTSFGNFMRYLSADLSSCVHRVSDLSSKCVAGGELSATKFFDATLRVGTIRTATTTTPTLWSNLNYTGVYSTPDPDSDERTFLGSATLSADGTSTTSSFTMPEPSWDGVTCTCSNVLRRVEYTVHHEESGQVSSIPAPDVVIVLTSITASSCSAPSANIVQEFQTTYELNSASTTSTTPLRPKSGNPGYITGLPLLSGLLTEYDDAGTMKQAILQDEEGMIVMPVDSAGLCSTTGTRSSSIAFGQDQRLSCYLSLTQTDLQDLCTGSVMDPLALVGQYFGNVTQPSTNLYLGIFGDADFRDVNEWIKVTKNSPTAPVNWDSSTRSCTGLPSGLVFDVATVDVGAFNNPQRRVLSAQMSYTTHAWSFLSADPTTTQYFPLVISVRFVHIPIDGTVDYVPDSPPLLPKFPSDLLYPLYIENAATTSTNAPITSFTFLLLLSILMLFGMQASSWCL